LADTRHNKTVKVQLGHVVELSCEGLEKTWFTKEENSNYYTKLMSEEKLLITKASLEHNRTYYCFGLSQSHTHFIDESHLLIYGKEMKLFIHPLTAVTRLFSVH